MKILVTGGAGFIGRNLIEALLKDGHFVVALDNLTTGSKVNVKSFLKHKRFKFVQGGTEDLTVLKKLGQKFDQIYHLACPTGVPNIQMLGEQMLLSCSLGTWNILRLAKDNNAKLLFTSSSEIYGDPKVFPQAESYTGNVDPLGPRANYEEGKRFAETLVKWFSEKHKVDAKIIRLFNVYGPFMDLSDFRVIPQFMGRALKGEKLVVHGNGKQRRTLCYVSDIVNGLKLVMKKGGRGEVYNLGSDREMSMLDLAHTVIKLVGSKSGIRFAPPPMEDHKSRRPDLRRIYKLGWRPKVSLSKGLSLTLENFSRRLI